jgi:aspartyl-tRNA(Asn)/glutamyl-tRNA(Gln) amidotransferase subunit C
MADQIDLELFKHLVKLAALELDENESEYLRQQLNYQMKSIEELQAIPVDSITPPAAHGIPYSVEISQALRADEWTTACAPDEIIEQAPETEEGYIVVPEIPHTEV